ncbi:site-2 protease family protein [Leptolyngbya sp. FACHB-261]|uniref:site-2 protease family protein n=1 Tax=Leptolyngbya sp. FACHB-261 TaxID=2692806 RepID=UPI00168460B3|nr:site-2 protease family protein [Leptolyngbya sp. FACHB-261]MBD2100754.1 site-2 protease family protein [Leptolyngbya sp. FACHB-261]
MITILIMLVALGILIWGYYRAQPFGKPGVLAWLQSVVLMTPWLLFFGLFTAGIYIPFAALVILIVVSTGAYIFLGNQVRRLAQAAPDGLKTQASAGPAPEAEIERNPISRPEPEPTVLLQAAGIPAEDLQVIRGIFGIETFFATEATPYREGVIFKGNLRGEPTASHQRLSENLKQRMGDQYCLFLVEGQEGKPVVLVLPKAMSQSPTQPGQKALALALLLATVVTTLSLGAQLNNFDLFAQPERVLLAVPVAAALFGIFTVHELAHRWVAQRYNVRLSPPFFIPAAQLGSFGALTRFESTVPNRKALLDISLAGPAAGGLVSLALLLTGLFLSGEGAQIQVPTLFFQGSILVGSLARLILGEALQTSQISIHPLVLVGWLGLLSTALNLIPAGALDGGRIVQAIYGRRTASRSTLIALILLALAALVNLLALYWAGVILFLVRDLERPPLDEISETDDRRDALALLALFLMAAMLLPLSPGLAGRLGIG